MIAKTDCNTPCDEINEYAYIETVAKHGPLLQTIDLLNTPWELTFVNDNLELSHTLKPCQFAGIEAFWYNS